MNTTIKNFQCFLMLVLACLGQFTAFGTHIIGNQFSYQLIDSSSGLYHYRVTLVLYADALTGTPSVIAADNPAFFVIFKGIDSVFSIDSVDYASSEPLPADLSSFCGRIVPPDYFTLKRTFIKDYSLPASATGYTVAYQRCCRNGSLTNVSDPLNAGATYTCSIPPSLVARNNNCAVFTHESPQFAALDIPISFDCSATDADGDSLSYGLVSPMNCCSGTSSVKPIPTPPPYDSTTYTHPFSSAYPMDCSVPLRIDPVTGMMTGTPGSAGRYLISVYCSEWRHGVLINTSRREFEITVVAGVLASYRPFAGNDTTIMAGDSIQFDATGATSYLWSPPLYFSDTDIFNPIGYFPLPGEFTYVLYGASDSGCSGYDTIHIFVITHSEMVVPNGFTPNNDGRNDVLKPFSVLNGTLVSFKIFDRLGRLLFTSANINEGWDGTYNGAAQGMGVYAWEIIYKDSAGETRKATGGVTLVR